jgi:hypothetical protein
LALVCATLPCGLDCEFVREAATAATPVDGWYWGCEPVAGERGLPSGAFEPKLGDLCCPS